MSLKRSYVPYRLAREALNNELRFLCDDISIKEDMEEVGRKGERRRRRKKILKRKEIRKKRKEKRK